ncbi:transcriptional regulator, LacI family [Formosa agariphila KMM 3901]|uniref:Transcriptional regulator, LacI family n=1 Tax=Formosa agariphila (strain DSM 15362 / KCTC 12365 / LMG 23005 / KMM 3901 / M-2Alg 35-1) TaxID=1347342 RepID=T2KH52_FORAG|nr:LacI family DNA-binding transcriptional regulator [Formosa agariphila]CDF77731.1 transcriptional regulator, LacI family [Formosa agariphila KMM 3901]
MKQRITLKQIANTFNVSIATVSKALKDSHEISNATKLKIQEYAYTHNYRPNSIALSLLNKKTKTIGVIMPSILNPFFVKTFSGIEQVANDKGYNVIAIVSHSKLEKEIASIHMLENGLVDGLLISLSEETEAKQQFNHLKSFIDNAGPIVMFDRVSDSINTDKVIVDDFNCAYKATEHLIKTGCKHIAVVSTLDNVGIIKLRINGYLKALEDYKLPVNKKIINLIKPRYDFETEIKTMLDYQDVDAIIGLEEFSAVESMVIAQDRGYNIPDDISIISFTSSDFFKYTKPSITCINQHSVFMGKTAAEILISKIEQPLGTEDVFETKTIKTTLVERKSTKSLANSY